MAADGVAFKKKPADGNMRGIAFTYDPDNYWVEMIDRTATFAGICSNY
jgi:lactoylglutathione lyase